MAILTKTNLKKVAIRSEMARNAIKSYFRTSKMATTGHFVKNLKKIKIRIDMKWPEMPSKVTFGHPKWPPKKKILYRSEMALMDRHTL